MAPGGAETARAAPPGHVDYDALFGDLSRRAEVKELLEAFHAEKAALAATCKEAATAHQKAHTRNVMVAAVFGTAAIVCALAQLSGRFESVPFWLEMVALLVAGLAVARGLRAHRHHSWLLYRHKEERCHFLNWRLLTNPALWDGENESAQKAAIEEALTQLAGLMEPSYEFHRWIEESQVPLLPASGAVRPPARLRDIYLKFRLEHQQRYFAGASSRNDRLQRRSKYVAVVGFFGAVLVGLVHFVVELYEHFGRAQEGTSAAAGVSLALLLAAACIPVVGGTVRIIRNAFEPARNTVRFRHHEQALVTLIGRVKGASDARLANELWVSEFVLESEHRAWLSLMMEAEWFG